MAVESSTDLSSSEDSILYPCRKRRREEPDPDGHDSIHLSEPEINKLPDAMLFEILHRLPCRCALQCKSISKRWYSLISDPYFIRGFCHRHRKYADPFTLLLQYHLNILVVPSDNSELYLDCRGGGLNFLYFLPTSCFRFRIEAAFNDLLLVCSEIPPIQNSRYCMYYICNPLTKQSHMLRPLPFSTEVVMIGFICQPYSDKELSNYRYKAVRWIRSSFESNISELQMEIFSSETGEWSNFVVSLPPGRRFNRYINRIMDAGVVACNGMLHWVDADIEDKIIKGFVVYNPFNENEEQCINYIDPPIDFVLRATCSFGVFQGRLRIFQCPKRPPNNAFFFSVWELEDYGNAGTWCMKHKVYLNDVVSEHAKLVEIAKKSRPRPCVHLLAFHPNNGEIVFLQFLNYIVLCNMRTMVLKMAGQLRHKGKILAGNSSSLVHVPAKSVFLLGQPSWPTPVPPLPIVSY
jgi:hypothetical protein